MNAVGPMLFGCVVALDHLLLYPTLFSSESTDANGPCAIDLAAEVVESVRGMFDGDAGTHVRCDGEAWGAEAEPGGP
jgi:hypothetical protein